MTESNDDCRDNLEPRIYHLLVTEARSHVTDSRAVSREASRNRLSSPGKASVGNGAGAAKVGKESTLVTTANC